jgi:hypothetical protein
MPLPNSTIANTSNTYVEQSFEKIVKHQIPKQRLIGPRNFYLKDTAKLVDKATLADLRSTDMGQYMASSSIVHCYDGWNYLARACESLVNGDFPSAIHFTYYSELRSVMSLMAFEGFGIFNKRHVWFDSTGTPAFYNSGTHVVAHECISEWAKLASKKDFLFGIIRTRNRTLSDWIVATGYTAKSSYANLIAKDWLDKWSVDLKLEQDRVLRNEMSYRPQFEINRIAIKDAVSNLIKIWRGLEPNGMHPFNELDLHLCRIAIEQTFLRWKSRKPQGTEFRTFVTKMFSTVGEPTDQALFEFFLRSQNSNKDDHFIIQEAKKDLKDNRVNITNPFPMFSRAILMLRLATGASNRLIKQSTMAPGKLDYWWLGICKNIGIIDSAPEGDSSELFGDVSESINSIDLNDTATWESLKKCAPSHSQDLNILKQFQRACFWGLGL